MYCRGGIFERMPVLTTKKELESLEGGRSPVLNETKEQPVKQVSLTAPPKEPQQDSLLDLLGGGDIVTMETVAPVTSGGGTSLLDLLDSTPTTAGEQPYKL